MAIGPSVQQLPMLLCHLATRFFLPFMSSEVSLRYAEKIVSTGCTISDGRLIYMPVVGQLSHNEMSSFPAGTLAVTRDGSLYVKLNRDPGWGIVRRAVSTGNQDPAYIAPGRPTVEDAVSGFEACPRYLSTESVRGCLSRSGGDANHQRPAYNEAPLLHDERMGGFDNRAFAQLVELPQRDYAQHPRVQRPKVDLEVQYNCVKLSSILKGGQVYSEGEPVFVQGAPIGEKISICLAPMDVQPPITTNHGYFTTRQRRVRVGDGLNGRPITHAELVHMIATDVRDFMNLHQVMHHGQPIAFEQICLKAVRLRSAATIQPVLCLCLAQ